MGMECAVGPDHAREGSGLRRRFIGENDDGHEEAEAVNVEEGVTLQINLAPTDLPWAKHIVPHQLRVWANQVDEILLVLDKHRSRGRYSACWHERLPGMLALLDEICDTYPHARTVDVDYSPEVAAHLADTYFGGTPLPPKDCSGGPFYSFIYGLEAPKYRYVFHTDSDMMYGGGSPTWIAEAVELLQRRPEVIVCSPHPGPPAPDGRLIGLNSPAMEPEPHTSVAYRTSHLTWRLFLLDRKRLATAMREMPLLRPPLGWILKAKADGNPPVWAAEGCFSQAMVDRGLIRIDFLGNEPGMWSLHPPRRSELFLQRLPESIDAVERGDVPEGQLGDYDMNDSMIDWSSARKTIWQHGRNQLTLLARNFARADDDRPRWAWRVLKERNRPSLDRG